MSLPVTSVPSLLIVVTADPRQSPRTAEAVRIAAGLAAGGRVEVTLYLRGPAMLALSEGPADLMDEDGFRQYLPILGELGRPILVEAGAAELTSVRGASYRFEEISDQRLAEMAAVGDYVLRF